VHTTVSPQSLLTGDIPPQIRRLSVPLVFGMLAMSAFTFIDTYFIAQLGTFPLAALGFTISVVMFFMGIIYGLNVGTSSAVARAFGSGDMDRVRRVSTDAISLTAVTVFSAAVIGFLMVDPVFRALGVKPDMMPLVHDYMAVWYCGLPFLGLMMVANACIRGTGDTRFPAAVMIGVSVVNIALDPFLIFGWGFFPRLELTGAAATMTTAYVTTFLVSMYFVVFRRRMLSAVIIHPGLVRNWLHILHVAVPSMMSNLIGPLSMMTITWMAAQYGKEAVAALGVANRIDNLATLVFFGFGAGISIFSGQNFSSGNYGRIRDAAAYCFRVMIAWGLFIAGVLWIFADDIPHLFDKNADVIAYATQYLHWVPISYAGMGVMVIVNAILNGSGKPLPATFFIFLKAFILYVPLAWWLQQDYGFTGIVAALMLANFIVGISSYVYHRKVMR
jgi:putative MATE family efflux protein